MVLLNYCAVLVSVRRASRVSTTEPWLSLRVQEETMPLNWHKIWEGKRRKDEAQEDVKTGARLRGKPVADTAACAGSNRRTVPKEHSAAPTDRVLNCTLSDGRERSYSSSEEALGVTSMEEQKERAAPCRTDRLQWQRSTRKDALRVIRNTQIKANNDIPRHTYQVAKIDHADHADCWRGWGARGALIHCWRERETTRPLGKTGCFLTKLNIPYMI